VFLREPRDSPRKLRIQTTNAIWLDQEIGSREGSRANQLQDRAIDDGSDRLHAIERKCRIHSPFALAAVKDADRRIVAFGYQLYLCPAVTPSFLGLRGA
jgi:hypothetical protein